MPVISKHSTFSKNECHFYAASEMKSFIPTRVYFWKIVSAHYNCSSAVYLVAPPRTAVRVWATITNGSLSSPFCENIVLAVQTARCLMQFSCTGIAIIQL